MSMQKDSRGEQNKETEAMCRISVSLGTDCQLTKQGLPLRWVPQGDLFPSVPAGAEGLLHRVPGRGCWANFVKNMKLTFLYVMVFPHRELLFMHVSNPVIMSPLSSSEPMACQGALCASTLSKCIEIIPEIDSKTEKRDLLTDTQSVTRKPERPQGFLCSSPL